ncbi:type I-E CRISPR-associated protein Cse2/CasB [Nocardiopsis sp. N85]|uniref:type I-E CRISPR-associated protein Cse2/CasB n=1 Tax=Nocardiopsis sp. N85 TaxID=3029400 RepID=UPI00237F885B|nr:type I-E CRISPR-associated protein Cse2/CasB [Nocardiopsis sp. N85]MDE3720445.1 type I-E CRISPR-associated protein Cse2/CasB [Nocardiopsis sp. N85]
MTTTTTTEYIHDLHDLGAFVDERIRPIQGGYMKDRPEAVAILAKLRRGAGKSLTAVPELLGLTLDHDFYEKFPPGHPHIDAAEAAAHEALTLYALHQQSKREQGMHKRGRDLGGAVRRLMPGGTIDEPLRKRFVQAGSALDDGVRLDRLRGIVKLLRASDVPLDYGLLADQLYRIRAFKTGPARVRAEWGRGFQSYRPPAADREGEAGPATAPTDD